MVSVSFRKHTPEEIIKAAAESGLSCIEWGSDVHAPCRDLERLDHIVRLQDRYGISCCSYGTYFKLGETPLEELEHYILAARRLGTDILRLWCGTKCGDKMSEAEVEELFAECRRAAAIAEHHGVTLCMECHMRTFTERAEDTERLMRAVNSPYFRMYWQPFQWLSPSESLEVARTVAPYARHIHVFNWQGSLRFPLADALDVWRTYLGAFSAPRTLLLEFMPDDALSSLPAEAEALHKLIASL